MCRISYCSPQSRSQTPLWNSTVLRVIFCRTSTHIQAAVERWELNAKCEAPTQQISIERASLACSLCSQPLGPRKTLLIDLIKPRSAREAALDLRRGPDEQHTRQCKSRIAHSAFLKNQLACASHQAHARGTQASSRRPPSAYLDSTRYWLRTAHLVQINLARQQLDTQHKPATTFGRLCTLAWQDPLACQERTHQNHQPRIHMYLGSKP